MRTESWIYAVAVFVCIATSAAAQFKEPEQAGTQAAGKSQVTRWRVGMIITASGGPCKGMDGYAPVPTDWPEQQVEIVKEDISPGVRSKYEMVDGGVKIMTVHVAQLPANAEAKALVTVEIRRHEILPPDDTDIYVCPDLKKLPGPIKRYLQPSPKIESRDPKIRALAKEVGADKEKAWERVEAIYDWVREHVKYKNGPLKGALAALRDGYGDCEELTSLFIAICRAADIPARTVWVPQHCYPEFYLEDEQGEGHWFPCEITGARQFGGITELRPVLQKGDSFRAPRNAKERQRYMAESLVGTPATKNGGPPQCRFVREPALN